MTTKLRRPPSPPKLLLAIIPMNEESDGLGVDIPGEEAFALSILDRALESFVDRNLDVSQSGRAAIGMAGALRRRVWEAKKILLQKRNDYYHALIAGVGVRADSVAETIRLSVQRRSHHVGIKVRGVSLGDQRTVADGQKVQRQSTPRLLRQPKERSRPRR